MLGAAGTPAHGYAAQQTINAVDSGYAVDRGANSAPDQPHNPYQPRYLVGGGTAEAGVSRVMHVTRVRPSVCAFTGEDSGYRVD